MPQYKTLVDTLHDLEARGYTFDFNIKDDCLHCAALGRQLSPDEFEVVEVYRFEGMSNPDDNSVVYAIEGPDGLKGTLVNAYGMYADAASDKLIAKLQIKH
ncbi:hypothetical protein BH09BAC1_BH09BAC1_13640 [soil metagenome]